MILNIYKFIGSLLKPYLENSWIKNRLREEKEDPSRYQEKFGIYQEDFHGRSIWCHGASVGETLALLPLIKELRLKHPDKTVVLTSCTLTSKDMIESRLPEGAIHIFAPLDVESYIERFIAHFNPTFAVFIESEIWPTTLHILKSKRIPAYLVSARLSPKSQKIWGYFAPLFRRLGDMFTHIYTQSPEQKTIFKKFGLKQVTSLGNLKFAASPLPYSKEDLDILLKQVGSRPLWLAASTHEGEEELMIQVHGMLKSKFPDLLTLIAPRHPKRLEDILTYIPYERSIRSRQEPITPDTEIYICDTLGEMGLFFKLSSIVFLGGSLVPIGGHNLLEPALSGCAILHGPHMHKTTDLKELFKKTAKEVRNVHDLANELKYLLNHPGHVEIMGIKAQNLATQESQVLENLLEALP